MRNLVTAVRPAISGRYQKQRPSPTSDSIAPHSAPFQDLVFTCFADMRLNRDDLSLGCWRFRLDPSSADRQIRTPASGHLSASSPREDIGFRGSWAEIWSPCPCIVFWMSIDGRLTTIYLEVLLTIQSRCLLFYMALRSWLRVHHAVIRTGS